MTGFRSKKAMANDKVADLIKETVATVWIDHAPKGPIPMYTQDHMEWLASLVVAECLDILHLHGYDDAYNCLVANFDKDSV